MSSLREANIIYCIVYWGDNPHMYLLSLIQELSLLMQDLFIKLRVKQEAVTLSFNQRTAEVSKTLLEVFLRDPHLKEDTFRSVILAELKSLYTLHTKYHWLWKECTDFYYSVQTKITLINMVLIHSHIWAVQMRGNVEKICTKVEWSTLKILTFSCLKNVYFLQVYIYTCTVVSVVGCSFCNFQ